MRRRIAGPLLAALALVAPQQALAAGDFYASQAGGGDCSQASPCSLDTAVAAAESVSGGNVRIVGALTRTTQLVLAPGDFAPIRLIGSGTGDGGTLFDTGAAGALTVNQGSSVEDVRVRTTTATAVQLEYGGTVARSVIQGASGLNSVHNGTGAALPAVVSETSIAATGSAVTLGNGTSGMSLEVRDSTLSGTNGIHATGTVPVAVVLQRNTITASNTGIDWGGSESVRLSASGNVVKMSGPGAVGVRMGDIGSSSASLRQNTFDGTDATGASRGILVGTPQFATGPVVADVRGSIVRGFAQDLDAEGGSPAGSITVANSNYATTGGGAGAISDGGGNVDADPGYLDRAAGNYALAAGSAMIDAAGSDPISDADRESATDRAGTQRIVDGNGDGVAARDIGAFEFVLPPPPPPPPLDTEAPVVDASLTATVFRVDRKGASEVGIAGRRRRPPRGTTFRYSLSEAAQVAFTIQRSRPGRRVKGRCKKPTRRTRKRRRCTRWVRVARFGATANAGPNEKSFSGRIDERALKPGRYRAVLHAADAAGNRSAAKRLRFRVVR